MRLIENLNPRLNQGFEGRWVALRDGSSGLRGGLCCEVRETGGPDELEFIASDESVDRYNEVIAANAWNLTNYRRNPVVVDSHDYSSVTKIVGRSTTVEVRSGKLVNRVRFATENPLGRIAFGMSKGGFIRSESVGFIPISWHRGDESQGEPSRTFRCVELIEISLVAIPANPGATIGNALKSGCISRSDLRSLADALKPFCNDPADSLANARAAGLGIDAAQLRQLTQQLFKPLGAVLRRA